MNPNEPNLNPILGQVGLLLSCVTVFIYIFQALDVEPVEIEIPMLPTSKVMGVQRDCEFITDSDGEELEVCYMVKKETIVKSKPRQMWKKGTADRDGYFTLLNPHTGKLLTATPNQKLIVKPGVLFDNSTGSETFDFSGALPRGTKVTFLSLPQCL